MEETLLTVEDAVLTIEEEVEKKPAPRRRTTRSRSTASDKAAAEKTAAEGEATILDTPEGAPLIATRALPDEPSPVAVTDNEKAVSDPEPASVAAEHIAVAAEPAALAAGAVTVASEPEPVATVPAFVAPEPVSAPDEVPVEPVTPPMFAIPDGQGSPVQLVTDVEARSVTDSPAVAEAPSVAEAPAGIEEQSLQEPTNFSGKKLWRSNYRGSFKLLLMMMERKMRARKEMKRQRKVGLLTTQRERWRMKNKQFKKLSKMPRKIADKGK